MGFPLGVFHVLPGWFISNGNRCRGCRYWGILTGAWNFTSLIEEGGEERGTASREAAMMRTFCIVLSGGDGKYGSGCRLTLPVMVWCRLCAMDG